MHERELGGDRLAEDVAAGGDETLHASGVARRAVAREGRRAVLRRQVGRVDDVLDADRNPVQRSCAVRWTRSQRRRARAHARRRGAPTRGSSPSEPCACASKPRRVVGRHQRAVADARARVGERQHVQRRQASLIRAGTAPEVVEEPPAERRRAQPRGIGLDEAAARCRVDRAGDDRERHAGALGEERRRHAVGEPQRVQHELEADVVARHRRRLHAPARAAAPARRYWRGCF